MNKKLISIATALLAATGLAVAADNVALSVTSAVGNTNTFITSARVQGYVDSVYVSTTNTTPIAVTLTTPRETILSATFTNSGNYRVRLQDCTSAGSLISQYDRLMIFDQVSLMATQGTGTNVVFCILRLSNPLTP